VQCSGGESESYLGNQYENRENSSAICAFLSAIYTFGPTIVPSGAAGGPTWAFMVAVAVPCWSVYVPGPPLMGSPPLMGWTSHNIRVQTHNSPIQNSRGHNLVSPHFFDILTH